MFLIITEVVIFIIIIGLLYLLTWFLPTDSPWAPWWTTSLEKSRALCKLIRLGRRDVFYELGSGTGTTTVVVAKEFGAKVIGIESSKSRIWWSRMKAKRNGVSNNLTFLQKDFFAVDLSPASVVYLYLVPRVIYKLKPKLLKELKPGTKVASLIYRIDYLPLLKKDEREQLYIYEIPSRKK
jgi:SAM-dependent methyltransferase